ncbi:ankyrin repeat-containing domain protein [Tirmania nivea]|nr:ankyrin repeat-containing domain protein [Tirmania nivea]
MGTANGHQAVVRLLLERNDVDVDAKDNSGWSPLSLAAMSGYEAVVRLLVEQDNINLDAKDSEGRAALDLATLNGNTSIAELIQAAAAHHEHLDAHCS